MDPATTADLSPSNERLEDPQIRDGLCNQTRPEVGFRQVHVFVSEPCMIYRSQRPKDPRNPEDPKVQTAAAPGVTCIAEDSRCFSVHASVAGS